MRRLAWLLHRHQRAALEGFGINVSDLHVLSLLRADGPCTPSDIGQVLGLRSGTLTAQLDRLERRGLIVRRPHPDDRRKLLIEITEAGDGPLIALRNSLGGVFATFPPEWQTEFATVTAALCAEDERQRGVVSSADVD